MCGTSRSFANGLACVKALCGCRTSTRCPAPKSSDCNLACLRSAPRVPRVPTQRIRPKRTTGTRLLSRPYGSATEAGDPPAAAASNLTSCRFVRSYGSSALAGVLINSYRSNARMSARIAGALYRSWRACGWRACLGRSAGRAPAALIARRNGSGRARCCACAGLVCQSCRTGTAVPAAAYSTLASRCT